MAKNLLPRRSHKGKKFIGEDTVIDMTTGEIIDRRSRFRTEALKTIFITMYLNDENVFELISGLGNSGKVLAYVLRDYNDKTGMFYFSKTNKDLMVSTLNLSVGTIRSSVKDFAHSRILIYVGGNEYMVNPKIFYKGPQTNYDNMVNIAENLLAIAIARESNARIDAKAVEK